MRSLNIKSSDDKEKCHISGMDQTPSGSVLLADFWNRKIKLFSPDHELISDIQLSAPPNDVSVVDNQTAVVATNDSQLQFLDISNPSSIKLKRKERPEFSVLASAPYRSNLVVISSAPAALKMIDQSCKKKWSLCLDFSSVWYVVCKSVSGRPAGIVSCQESLTFVDIKHGDLIKTIDVKNKEPRGLTTDNSGNLYVCYRGTKEVAVWSPDVTQNRVVLSGGDLRPDVWRVLYNKTTDQLIVSYQDTDMIDIFKMSY